MDGLLQGISGTVVYLDDILITGASEEEHLRSLEEVLRRLERAGLRLKMEKCEFARPSVSYLGHVIDKNDCVHCKTKYERFMEHPPLGLCES